MTQDVGRLWDRWLGDRRRDDRSRAWSRSAIGIFWATLIVAAGLAAPGNAAESNDARPNIIYILADDLGYAELGCYGQTRIRTPHIDRLAAEGMRFSQHYSGNPVCAPTRCTIMTGYHTGHAEIRGNKEMGGWGPDEPEGQLPIPDETVTVAELLKQHGYLTAAIGKWGLGGPDSSGHPNRQGFDLFYGYLCQRVAHNYYPTHLWRNGEKDILNGNPYFSAHQKLSEPPVDRSGFDRFHGRQYAPDLMAAEARQFIRSAGDRPFFLYFPTPVPHVSIQVPQDSLQEYAGQFDSEPYLGQKGYLPHPEPRAGYAAMITRLDREVGRIMRLLKELGLDENTIVMFSSDNGPTFNGGSDSEFFHSAGRFRGLKTMVYEGGIRVPMIARWPGKIAPGTVTDHVSAQWDVMPTLLEIAGVEPPEGIDGISFVPTLLGRGEQAEHELLYWELGRQQALRVGDWKLVRIANPRANTVKTELFHLAVDVSESKNLADERPEKLAEMIEIARKARTPSKEFPSPFDE